MTSNTQQKYELHEHGCLFSKFQTCKYEACTLTSIFKNSRHHVLCPRLNLCFLSFHFLIKFLFLRDVSVHLRPIPSTTKNSYHGVKHVKSCVSLSVKSSQITLSFIAPHNVDCTPGVGKLKSRVNPNKPPHKFSLFPILTHSTKNRKICIRIYDLSHKQAGSWVCIIFTLAKQNECSSRSW